MTDVRTDLTIELHADAVKELRDGEIDGIIVKKTEEEYCSVTKIEILNENGTKILGRPIGKYVTLEYGNMGISDDEKFYALCDILTDNLRKILEGKLGKRPEKVLVVGIGNADITADAVGPLTIKNIVVTGHLKKLDNKLFAEFGNVDITAISTGVMAQTGMESAEIIKSICTSQKPDVVIAVDALASNMMSRLATTLQISDTGLSPGAGIGNKRSVINSDILGVPVISVGVPTMVEIAALVADAFSRIDASGIDINDIRNVLGDESRVLVTPKDCGVLIADVSKLIGFAIDRALIDGIEYDELIRIVK